MRKTINVSYRQVPLLSSSKGMTKCLNSRTKNQKSHQIQQKPPNSSFGKIVKNKPDFSQASIGLNLEQNTRIFAHPLGERRNMIDEGLGLEYTRSTVTPSFGYFDENENIQIKKIEEKYKKLVDDYQNKKQAICAGIEKKTSIVLDNKIKLGKYSSSELNGASERFSKQSVGRQIGRQIKDDMVDKSAKVSSFGHKTPRKIKIRQQQSEFFEALKNQIIFEQDLKNLKSSITEQKRADILKVLKEEHKIQSIVLHLDMQQFDPFQVQPVVHKSDKELALDIYQKHCQCEQNWSLKVCSLDRKSCSQIFDYLNFEKGERISLKSLVRELGYLLQKYYRNRDIYKIYQRLAPVSLPNFCKVLVSK